MPVSESPCLSLAVTPLSTAASAHYATWVFKAPYPGGYVHHDRPWPLELTQAWQEWQALFSLRGLPQVPQVSSARFLPQSSSSAGDSEAPPIPYSGRLMQHLGVSLWQWLFDGTVQSSFDQSLGIAFGQAKPLRLRLDIRDPDLIALPWEIMQPERGKQAISLSQQILFSRTTSAVDPLPPLRVEETLKVLLVLGQEETRSAAGGEVTATTLKLEQEAEALAEVFVESSGVNLGGGVGLPVPCQVHKLVQPTPAELIHRLETGAYNILFYAGHGIPAPDGGQLLLRSGTSMNGTELAQVLTRCRVPLAVFNACWGAQPDQADGKPIPRSSLAEVLIHHGVPAVLGMRDSIADQEALSFIQVFAQALAERLPIDRAVAVARQHLLTLYKFNQPAWTLPVLYMHPEFNGELIKPHPEGMTELPNSSTLIRHSIPTAFLRLQGTQPKIWSIRGGLIRVGRKSDNDLVVQEQWVSQKHAEIFCRDGFNENTFEATYYLRDFSRYGTLVSSANGWQKIHHQEVPLQSGIQLKFGSSQGQALEFVIENSPSTAEA